MTKPRETLGRAELELLQWIHEHQPVSVADAVAGYGVERELARTTVQTMMQRLTAKGFLKRKKSVAGFEYSPVEKPTTIISSLIQDFVHGVLGGSVSPFVAYLNESHRLNESEIQELRKLVDQLEPSSDAETKKTGKRGKP